MYYSLSLWHETLEEYLSKLKVKVSYTIQSKNTKGKQNISCSLGSLTKRYHPGCFSMCQQKPSQHWQVCRATSSFEPLLCRVFSFLYPEYTSRVSFIRCKCNFNSFNSFNRSGGVSDTLLYRFYCFLHFHIFLSRCLCVTDLATTLPS